MTIIIECKGCGVRAPIDNQYPRAWMQVVWKSNDPSSIESWCPRCKGTDKCWDSTVRLKDEER